MKYWRILSPTRFPRKSKKKPAGLSHELQPPARQQRPAEATPARVHAPEAAHAAIIGIGPAPLPAEKMDFNFNFHFKFQIHRFNLLGVTGIK